MLISSSSRPSRNFATLCRAALAWSRVLRKYEAGVVAVTFAVVLPILIGFMGLAAEVSYWRLHQRAMQNAADAAAIAAATNGGTTSTAEALAVAAQYGFQDGAGNIKVTVTTPSTASGCASKWFNVVISDKLPLLLTKVVGFQGEMPETIAVSLVQIVSKLMKGTEWRCQQDPAEGNGKALALLYCRSATIGQCKSDLP